MLKLPKANPKGKKSKIDLDLIDELLDTARKLTLSTEHCLRCELITSKMYITNNCGHLYCLRCLRQIKRCVKCHKTINIKDLIYIDITKKSTKHIDLFQKEIDKLRLAIIMEHNNELLNSKTSIATVAQTFVTKFDEDEFLFDHQNCDCMHFCGLHFRTLGIKNEKPWINKKSSNGETYLFMACKHGKAKVAETLISWGAHINIQDARGWTPLHKAVLSGNIYLVENLLKRGAFINVPSEKYNTPLHKAVDCNNFKMAKLLITFGADINFRNYEGHSPWQLATQKMRNLMKTLEKGQIILSTPIFRKQFKFFIIGSLSFRASYPMKYLMRYIDITFIDEMNEDVTHVIYEGRSKIIPVTYNFLLAIVYRVPVVTKEWIEVCVIFKQLHSYSEYLIIGTDDYKNDAVNRAVINYLKLEPKLFSGCYFYVPEPEEGKYFYLEKELVSLDQFIALLTVGGAKILKQKPDNFRKQNNKYPWHALPGSIVTNCCYYVVYMPNDANILGNYDSKYLRYVPYSWIYECILHYRIVPPRLSNCY